MTNESSILRGKRYLVIDSFLDEKIANEIEDLCLDYQFPWYFGYAEQKRKDNFSTVDKGDPFGLHNHPLVNDGVQAVHHIVKEREVVSQNFYKEYLSKILFKMDSQFGVERVPVQRAKCNLQTQLTNNKPTYFNVPHIDIMDRHISFIYYINDNDGHTIFFTDESKDKNSPLEIEHRVESKKNRIVFFDGSILHTGQNPINSHLRAVINVNIDWI